MNIVPFLTLRKYCLAVLILLPTACTSTNSKGPVPEGYYRVKPGDNLYRIALCFNQKVNTLAAWNNLRDPTQIEVGQLLRVRAKIVSASSSRRHTQAVPNRVTTSSTTNVAVIHRLNLQWPVTGTRNNIIATFNGTTNKGIDISGKLGTPIKAAAAGDVLYTGEEVRGYGKLILLNHGNNTLTAYAHNDQVLVKKGQKVQAGQTIAKMGNGGTDSVKLHFELRVNSKAVNPLPYLH